MATFPLVCWEPRLTRWGEREREGGRGGGEREGEGVRESLTAGGVEGTTASEAATAKCPPQPPLH